MIINVTQKDIDEGLIGDCELCPVARAISREFPDVMIEVGGCRGVSFVNDDLEFFTVELPLVAVNFVESFDDHNEWLEPFSFPLEVPDDKLESLVNCISSKEEKE